MEVRALIFPPMNSQEHPFPARIHATIGQDTKPAVDLGASCFSARSYHLAMPKAATTGVAPALDARDEAFAYQLEFLKLEFGHINDAIGRIDETTAKVKDWAIVTWAGSVGLVLGQQQLHPLL